MSDSGSSRDQSLARGPVPVVESHQPYEYQPLPDGDYVRRLILEPGTDDDPLVGRLEVIEATHAKDSRPFEAISYAWGTGGRNQPITIDGKRMPITTTLSDALRQTRYPDRSRSLWADSICIDQGKDEEKGHQVALMGRIYKTSSCTLICLGLDAEDQEDAYDAAALIDDVNEMMDRVFADPKFSWDWNAFPFPQADNPLRIDDRWKSWTRLVKCPWFKRGWVVQEAALGPAGLVLWAGVEIPWISVLRCDYWLRSRAYHLMPTLTPRRVSEILSRTYAFQRSTEAKTFLRKQISRRLDALSLLQILDFARSTDVSNRKDRIYAFMALPTSDGAMPALQPDYGRNTSHLDVYRDFAIKYLNQNSNLDLLSLVEHERESEEDEEGSSFPSWIPRWDRGGNVQTWFDEVYRKMHTDAPDFALENGNAVLRVKGIVFDSVRYVSDTIKDTSQASEAVEQVVSLWRHVAPLSTKYPGPHQPRLALAFLVAICRARYDGDREEWRRSRKAFSQLLQADHPDCPMDTYTRDSNSQRFSIFVANHLYTRRLVLLGRGYYGLASTVTREGDVCAIIFGTLLPFILREVAGKKGHYTVVGAAHIQSKLYDEDGIPYRLGAVEDSDDLTEWDLPTQDIFLH